MQLEVGLGERIEASLWDARSKNIHRRASGVDVSRTRLQMDEKSNEVSRQFQELVLALKRLPTSEEFRSYRKGHFDPVTGVKTPFEVYIQSFIDNFDRTPKRGDVVNGSVETKKKYQSHFNILRVFAEEEGEELSWANIDGEFCTKMKQWRSRQPAGRFTRANYDDRRTAQTTVARWVKAVRGWLSMAYKQGIHPYRHFDQPQWSTVEGTVLRWVLTEAQLQAFRAFEVQPSRHGAGAPRTGLKRVKDLFVVQCYTGVRFSDLKGVVEGFNEDPDRKTVTVFNNKTKKQVTIPIHPMIREIAEEYPSSQLPSPGSLQKFNKNLRAIACESGLFDSALSKPITDAEGNWTTQRTAQWEQLSSHTARRTFATMAVQRGIPIKVIMNITGHSSEREFNKYVNISAEKNAELFASYWV